MPENQNCLTTFDVSLLREINKICEALYGIHGEVHLQAFVNQALLCSIQLKTASPINFWWTSFISQFYKICELV
jgi:hypothetical protein